MGILSKKNSSSCSVCCKISKWIACLLLFVAAVLALVGVYQTHVLTGSEVVRFQFGSSSGSLAIVAFVLAISAWGKHLMCCMSTCAACSK